MLGVAPWTGDRPLKRKTGPLARPPGQLDGRLGLPPGGRDMSLDRRYPYLKPCVVKSEIPPQERNKTP